MPLCRGNRTKKIGKENNIELSVIVKFVKFIQAVACGLLGISVIGLLLVRGNTSAQVVYTMVIVVNLIVILGGKIPVKFLTNRSK